MEKAQKALTPDEQTILGNIQTLVGELLQMNQEPAQPAPAPAAAAKGEGEMTDEEKKKMEEKAKKDQVTTPSDGATANDNTEERIKDPEPEESQKKVQEVAKAFVMALQGQIGTPEPAKPVDPVLKAVQDLATSVNKAVSGIAKSNEENSQAIRQIFNGLGVAEQMQVAEKAEKENGGTPINSSVNNEQTLAFINQVAKSLQGGTNKNENENLSNDQIVRKNLAEPKVLEALVVKRD